MSEDTEMDTDDRLSQEFEEGMDEELDKYISSLKKKISKSQKTITRLQEQNRIYRKALEKVRDMKPYNIVCHCKYVANYRNHTEYCYVEKALSQADKVGGTE